MAMDLRELSFQNVLDTILKPAGVKVGGFPEEIFQNLSESDMEKWTCSICYLIVKDSHECNNRHQFCHTCIFAWTLTFGENSEKCPVCRCEQNNTYKPNKHTDKEVGEQRVKCPEDDCSFSAPLKIFLMHGHGKTTFSNAHVDLESLRPAHQAGERLLIMPLLGASRSERGMTIRQQLQQGRVMIHQMMLLLHMEMQLRQQALVGYTQAQDPTVRLQRLDEVLALNEQLNEVGGILSTLLNTPLNRLSSAVRDRPSRQQSTATGSSTSSSSLGTRAGGAAGLTSRSPRASGSSLSLPRPRTLISTTTTSALDDDDDEDDDDDDDDDSSDTSSEASALVTVRGRFGPGRTPRPIQSSATNRPQSRNNSSIPRPTQPSAPLSGQPSTASTSTRSTNPTLTDSNITQRGTITWRTVTQPPPSSNAHTSSQISEASRPSQRPLVARARTPMHNLARRTSEDSTITTVQGLGNSSLQEGTARSTSTGNSSLPQISNSTSNLTSGTQTTSSSTRPSQPADGPGQHSLLPSGSLAHQRTLFNVRSNAAPTSASSNTIRNSTSHGISGSQSTSRVPASLPTQASGTNSSNAGRLSGNTTIIASNGALTPRRPSSQTRTPAASLAGAVRNGTDSTQGASSGSGNSAVTSTPNSDRGTFVPNPTPPTNRDLNAGASSSTSSVLSSQTPAAGLNRSSSFMPNSVARQRSQVNPRAVVRARRVPLPKGRPPAAAGTRQAPASPAQSSSSTVYSRGSVSGSTTMAQSPSPNRVPSKPTTSILDTAGAISATPDREANPTPKRRPSQPKQPPLNGGVSGAAGQLPRPRRRSEIAQQLRELRDN